MRSVSDTLRRRRRVAAGTMTRRRLDEGRGISGDKDGRLERDGGRPRPARVVNQGTCQMLTQSSGCLALIRVHRAVFRRARRVCASCGRSWGSSRARAGW